MVKVKNETYTPFFLDDYIAQLHMSKTVNLAPSSFTMDRQARFDNLCDTLRDFIKAEWDKEQGKKGDNEDRLLETHRRAIIGYTLEVNYFKDKIREYLKANNLLEEWHPKWFPNLIDAIFHENWGITGLYEWMYNYKESSSAKIIGDRIYYLINGEEVLQEQKISLKRFQKLRKAMMLKDPKRRLDEDYSELYMHSGERLAVFTGDLTFEGQDVMIFRKYIVENLTFEEQAKRGTIPEDAIPLFKSMVKFGPDVAFVGPPRTGKSTFLVTWECYENDKLEGVAVMTDPEFPFHKIKPKAPIMQIIADGEVLANIGKVLVRTDADYMIFPEARDGNALNIAVKMNNKGTRRGKLTYHLKYIDDFCYDIANEIIATNGGKLDYVIVKVARSFNYIFEFIQLKNRSQKRLKSIYELCYDKESFQISYHQICKYNKKEDNWSFYYDISEDLTESAIEEDEEAFKIFKSELKKLSEKYPMNVESNIRMPFYSKVGG